MRKKDNSSSLALITILAGLAGIISLIKKHPIITVCCIVAVILLIIFIKDQKRQNRDSTYDQIFFEQFLDMTDTEKSLYFAALKSIDAGIDYFSPHDMGVRGYNYSGNHYTDLYDKGYFDRVKRGMYSVNPTTLQRTINNYQEAIQSRITRAQSANTALTKDTVALYLNDLKIIHLTNGISIPLVILNSYMNQFAEK